MCIYSYVLHDYRLISSRCGVCLFVLATRIPSFAGQLGSHETLAAIQVIDSEHGVVIATLSRDVAFGASEADGDYKNLRLVSFQNDRIAATACFNAEGCSISDPRKMIWYQQDSALFIGSSAVKSERGLRKLDLLHGLVSVGHSGDMTIGRERRRILYHWPVPYGEVTTNPIEIQVDELSIAITEEVYGASIDLQDRRVSIQIRNIKNNENATIEVLASGKVEQRQEESE